MDDGKRPQDVLEGITYTTDTVAELLRGLAFPAGKDEVVAHLERKSAPRDVVEGVRGAETDRFDGLDDVMRVVGGYAV